jgi:hypothetical protein
MPEDMRAISNVINQRTFIIRHERRMSDKIMKSHKKSRKFVIEFPLSQTGEKSEIRVMRFASASEVYHFDFPINI